MIFILNPCALQIIYVVHSILYKVSFNNNHYKYYVQLAQDILSQVYLKLGDYV